jgi:acyl-CoA thioester hydrolase
MKSEFKQMIYYKDTDAEGVVYYANYLGYFEIGRTELLREMKVSLRDLKDKEGIVFAIIKVDCDYKAPAVYGDELTITTEIAETTAAKITFKQEALRGKELLVTAKITACAINIKTFKPVKLPPEIS